MAKPRVTYGATCYPGGRRIELTSIHREWLDWAVETLYQAGARERPKGPYPSCRTPAICNLRGYCPNDPACNE